VRPALYWRGIFPIHYHFSGENLRGAAWGAFGQTRCAALFLLPTGHDGNPPQAHCGGLRPFLPQSLTSNAEDPIIFWKMALLAHF